MITALELFAACERFHAHYDNCPDCHNEQTALCPEGNRLNEVASKLRDLESAQSEVELTNK